MRKLAITLSLILASTLQAGHESHGSDSNVESLAWFLGEGRVIHYCLESTEKFRKAGTEGEMRKAIKESFDQWIDYINTRKVDTFFFPKELASQLTYAKKLEWTGKACKGDEDLTFYFGVDNSKTRAARERFDDPMALVSIPKYDPDRTWQKGFVWIADPGAITSTVKTKTTSLIWAEECDVLNVLLHEWGHIFGIGHIQGTVMDSNLKQILLSETPDTYREPTIDGSKELYVLYDTTEEYFLGSFFPDEKTKRENFLRMMGREPQGEILLQLHYDKPINDGKKHQSTFLVKDDKGQETFLVEMLYNSPSTFLGEEIFRRRLSDGQIFFNRHSGNSVRGYLHVPVRDANGKAIADQMYAISVETNSAINEAAVGSASDVHPDRPPVVIYSYGLQQDVMRGAFFQGEHVTPPGGYHMLPYDPTAGLLTLPTK